MNFGDKTPMADLIFVVHAYQPPYPIQEKEIIKRIVDRTYRPFGEIISNKSNIKVVLNLNGCLTEILQNEYPDVINLFKKGIENGNLEITGSGYFHPILPLIEYKELKLQVRLNKQINNLYLTSKLNGFWPPELAVDSRTVQVLADMKYKTVIVPSNALKIINPNEIYWIKGIISDDKIAMLPRNRDISNKIAFRQYGNNYEAAAQDVCNTYNYFKTPVVLAMDLETFGEHHQGYLNFLFGLLGSSKIKSLHCNNINFDNYNNILINEITPTSWSTDDENRNKGIPFPLWNHPHNSIHNIQHAHSELMRLAIRLFGSNCRLPKHIQQLYLSAQHSCQYWWAHGFGHLWSPDMIRKGFDLQREFIKEITNLMRSKNKNAIRKMSEVLMNRLNETLRTK